MTWLRDDPVLLVGMHRSGTTLLARLLTQLDLHLGHHLEENHESIPFLEANDRALHLAHASWDRPESWPWLLERDEARAACKEQLLNDLRARSFRWRYGGIAALWRDIGPRPWGFKDPRGTLTFPLWREIFPNLRVVILRRHGVDVAASLQHRATQQLLGSSKYTADPHLARFASLRCLELARAFELWRFYNDFFDTALPSDMPCLDLRYEELLDEPSSQLERIAEFIGLETTVARREAVSGQVKSSRRLAYREDPRLSTFARTVEGDPTLMRLGYDTQ